MPLHKRASTYQSRTVIPLDLQPLFERREICKSLHTSCPRAAKMRARAWEGHLSLLFTELRKAGHMMSRDEVFDTVDRYLAQARDALLSFHIERGHPLSEGQHENQLEALSDLVGDLRRAIALSDYKIVEEEVCEIVADTHVPPEVRRRIAHRLLVGKLELIEIERRLLLGEPEAAAAVPVARAVPTRSGPVAGPRLSEVVTQHIASRAAADRWAPRTKLMYETLLRQVVELLGDRPVTSLTKEHMRGLQADLTRLPANATKVFPGRTARQAVDEAADLTVPRLSASSINKVITATKSLWLWAVKHDIVLTNVAEALENVRDEGNKRLPFTDEDLVKFFGRVGEPRGKTEADAWMPWLLLYTGARLEELAQLHAEDVLVDGGCDVISINSEGDKKLKTASSVRVVPIHSRLLALGFLEFARGRTGHLWPALTHTAQGYSGALSKRLGRELRRAGIADKRKVAAHSFRHTVTTRLGNAGVPAQTIDRLLGWSGGQAMRSNYTHAFDVATLRDAIEELRFSV